MASNGSSGLTREQLRWLLGLGLSHSIKNAKRDFSNGFLFAEILQRYYPQDIPLHSFDIGASSEKRKRANWQLLEKILKKKGFKIIPDEVNGIIACQNGLVVPFLQKLHTLVTSSGSNGVSKANKPPKQKTQNSAVGSHSKDSQQAYNNSERGINHEREEQPTFYVPHRHKEHISHPAPQEYYEIHDNHARSPVASQSYYSENALNLNQIGGTPYHDNYAHQSNVRLPMANHSSYLEEETFGQYPSTSPYHNDYESRSHQDPQHKHYFKYDTYDPPSGPQPIKYDAYEEENLQRDLVQINYAPGQYANSRMQSMDADSSFHALHDVRHEKLNVITHSQRPTSNDNYLQRFDGEVFISSPKMQHRGASDLLKPRLSYAIQGQENRGISYHVPERNKATYCEDISYSERVYPQKTDSKYWELGKLGANLESKEIIDKKSKREKVRNFSNEIRRNNAKVVQKQLERQITGVEHVENKSTSIPKLSARQRALEFARNIPKPSAATPSNGYTYKIPKEESAQDTGLSELDRLVMQHDEDTQQIQAIRNQLARQLKVNNF